MNWIKRPLIFISSCMSLAGVSILYLLFTQSPGCACSADIDGSWGAMSVLRSQQAFHIEHESFADASVLRAYVDSPYIGLSKLHHYDFTVEKAVSNSELPEIAYVYAVPDEVNFQPQLGPIKGMPQPFYLSSVGAIAMNTNSENPGTGSFVGVVCASTAPAQIKLDKPIYTADGFTCPSDSVVSKTF
ncbi:MAG: hypothetical protein AAF810_13575 [Cyanobacteria bacterium P01_D01_bin.36]